MTSIYKKLTQIYHKNIFSKEGKRALEYLNKRGISEKAVKHFKIGFCSNNIGYNFLKDKFAQMNLTESGMFCSHKLADGLIDTFNNMIVLPVILDGETINFTSRYIGDDYIKYGANAPHKHKPGGFTCGYNEDALDDTYVIIVESPIDAITLWGKGFKSIATFGINGICEGTATRLKGKRVYIAYDKEENNAGRNGAYRLGDMLGKFSVKCHIIKWPNIADKVDVNSFFSYYYTTGRNQFIELMKNAEKYISEKKKKYDYIKSNADINSVVIKYVGKKKLTNRGYLINCPFHNESTPSMHIFTDKNEFFCYGCGIAGNAIQLLVQFEKNLGNEISYKDAFALLD